MKSYFFVFVFILMNVANARVHHFDSIKIPGAKCANGSDYKVFINKGSSDKLLVEFMGGGACWDKKSCSLIGPRAWIYPIPNINTFSIFTSNKSDNPFREHTMLYFPYCTADVHAGNLIEDYSGKKVYHYGYNNTLLALTYLNDQKIIQFDKFSDVTVWGTSAGAIGSLLHGKNVEFYLNPVARKTMILDSPGLHFGKKFWNKFSDKLYNSFSRSFSLVGLAIHKDDGFIAKDMAPVLENYHDWKMGFLFATRDIAMSRVYGEISQENQRALILGPHGLPAIAQPYSNVRVWLKESPQHTFYIIRKLAHGENKQGQSALEFAYELYEKP